MTARQQWAAVGVIILALAGGLGVASHLMRAQLFPVDPGSRAPDFRAKALTGAEVYRTLADYKRHPLLLNVWATYCEPCKQEIPSLERLYKAYGDKGLRIVSVDIEDNVSEDSIRTFARTYGMTFDLLHDPTHQIEKVYQVTGYPETFVIGPEGTIRKKWIGADDWTSLGNEALVAQLLGLQAPHPVADEGDR
jgi:peroxiredoxin